ncbi:hypothetical protein U0070_016097, partial [Myodes glareolus]
FEKKKMALLAEQLPRWFNSIKFSNFIKAAQITKRSTRPGKTLSNGFSSQALLSPDNCFLHWGIKTYKTSSLWNSFQTANSNRQENSSEQSTLLPSVSEKPERIPSLESELFLEEEEAIQIVAHPLLPLSSFTLGDYIDHSETLQQLVQLGVDLSKIERHLDVANFLLRLDFEKDIKQILLFLKDLGLEDSHLGPFLTKNYTIFSEDLENLKTRVAYLQSKHFSKTDIARMVRNAPFLLSFSVERLDNRLGFFQKELELSVKKVYHLELGFKHNEIQHMVTRVPKMLTANKRKLTETFDYVHNVMKIPHHIIVKFPQVTYLPALSDSCPCSALRLQVFNTRVFKIKERHLFLVYLGKAQYDPAKPNYVSLDKVVSIPDEVFCKEIAKTSVNDFEKFLKTL